MQNLRNHWLVGILTVLILMAAGGYSSGWFVPTETAVTEIAPGVWFRKTRWQPMFIGCNQGWIIFKEKIDFPWYKEWTGVAIRDRVENIEHVFRELGGK